MTLAELLLAVLAVHRVCQLVEHDLITQRWREAFYDRFPPSVDRARQKATWSPRTRTVVFIPRTDQSVRVSWWGQLIDCPWCLGWWLAAALAAALWVLHGLPLPLLWPPAISAGAALFAELAA